MSGRRVVVTGIGLVNAAGCGINEVWRRLRFDPPDPEQFDPPGGQADVTPFPVFRTPDYRLEMTGVSDECIDWLMRDRLHQIRDLRHLIAATGLAMLDASLAPNDNWGVETSVIIADEHPGLEKLCQTLFAFGAMPRGTRERFDALSEDIFRQNTFLLPHYVAKAFGLGGCCLFVNSACASGLNAIDIGAQQIRAGRTKFSVIAASDDALSLAKYLWFDDTGMYARDGKLRPFDAAGSGTIFGDGGSALILEELESALTRGARVYGEFRGAGFSQDGWRVTVPNPNARRYGLAVKRALLDAQVNPDALDLLVAHGTGIPLLDAYEARTILEVFHRKVPAVASLKAFFGHNLGGCALMEAAVMLKCMFEGWVPETRGHSTPMRRFALPVTTAWKRQPIRTAMKTTAALAGFYGAIVFTHVEKG